MKRLFDVVVAALLLVLASPVLALTALAVRVTSRGPVLHWSQRVGRNNVIFRMPKFRTMQVGTPQRATHLLLDSDRWITPVGRWLRTTSLDELPQLWSVLRGQMSLVGPRPALYNQEDLVTLRTERGVHRLTPGLTGWAQINGRDEPTISEKVALDAYYAHHRSYLFDLTILALTAVRVLRREGVRQADGMQPTVAPVEPDSSDRRAA